MENLPGHDNSESVGAAQLADDGISIATGIVGGTGFEEKGLEEFYRAPLGMLSRPVPFVHVTANLI